MNVNELNVNTDDSDRVSGSDDASVTAPTVRVYVPTPFRRLTSGQSHVEAQGATIRQVIESLEQRFPGFQDLVWRDDDILHYVNVYLNGEEVRAMGGAETTVRTGDEVSFVPMLAGGGMTDAAPPRVVLTPTQYDALIAHAREEFPDEACGLLTGARDAVKRVIRMTNTEHSPVAYVMDPKEQLKVFDEMDRDGHDLVGIYHSHTHSAAYPSATDVRMAFYPESAYVIVSLADQQAPVVRAFHIVDKQISEIEVTVR